MPSRMRSTGCTSSTDAIGYSFRNIQAGVLDVMVSGGVDAPIAPLILRGFMLMRIMTASWNNEPQRASRPFSRERDGFVIAEGAWFFVLEEMEQARARGGLRIGCSRQCCPSCRPQAFCLRCVGGGRHGVVHRPVRVPEVRVLSRLVCPADPGIGFESLTDRL